jgi:sulfotransferase family protein
MPKPNFFIVGAPRCGTTAMYEYLRHHPQVFMPYRKEPVYFGSDLAKRPPVLDEAGYLALFEPAGDAIAIGEATVWYLYSQTAPGEIKALAPNARIVIMLRNPIEMIHSLHRHWLWSASEDLADFGEAIAAEPDRAAGRRLPANVEQPIGLRYTWLGKYAPHVQRYLDEFGPERVLVLIYDDLADDGRGIGRQTLSFLGVDPDYDADFEVVNQNKRARSPRLQRLSRSKGFLRLASRLPPRLFHLLWRGLQRANIRPEARSPIDPELRRRLAAEFAPDVADLGRLLGRDLGHWTADGSGSPAPSPAANAAA